MKNKYEKLFDEFLDLTEFRLIKHQNDYNEYTDEYGHWSLIDLQGTNLGDIEGDRFKSAAHILDRMDIYINDYIIEDIEECLDEKSLYPENGYSGWGDMLINAAPLLPENKFEFDLLDMIINHCDEINLENCFYEEDN